MTSPVDSNKDLSTVNLQVSLPVEKIKSLEKNLQKIQNEIQQIHLGINTCSADSVDVIQKISQKIRSLAVRISNFRFLEGNLHNPIYGSFRILQIFNKKYEDIDNLSFEHSYLEYKLNQKMKKAPFPECRESLYWRRKDISGFECSRFIDRSIDPEDRIWRRQYIEDHPEKFKSSKEEFVSLKYDSTTNKVLRTQFLRQSAVMPKITTPQNLRVETSSSPQLHPDVSKRLQEFSQKSQAIFDAAQVLEQESVQSILQHPESLLKLIASQKKDDRELAELFRLRSSPDLCKFYKKVYDKLVGVCIASYSIKSSLVDHSSDLRLDVLKAGSQFPIVGPGISIIHGILEAINIRNHNHAVARLVEFFADFHQSIKEIKSMAILLTKERESEILSLRDQGKLEKIIKNLKHWFTADESNQPVVVKAAEDCETFLAAVLKGDLKPEMKLEEIVAHILRRPLSVSSTVLPSSVAPQLVADAVAPSDLQRLQEKYEKKLLELERKLLEAQRQTEKARIDARQAKEVVEFVHGPLLDFGSQLHIQDVDQTGHSAGHSVLKAIHRRFGEIESRVNQVGTATLVLQEKVDHLGDQIDNKN